MAHILRRKDGSTIHQVPNREAALELRDALNAFLGQPHITGEDVHNVASTARDIALEEAAHVASFRSQVTADAILALRSPERRG